MSTQSEDLAGAIRDNNHEALVGDHEEQIALVATIMKRQTMSYSITMEPGQTLSAKSLGKQLVAIEAVLCSVAKANFDAKLTCLISGIKYENDTITIDLVLMHTFKGAA